MKKILQCEVTALFDENRNGASVFRNVLPGDENMGKVYKELVLDLTRLYPGTVITMEFPECPNCQLTPVAAEEGICPCGHDWIEWSNERSKDVLWQDSQPSPEAVN